MKALIVRLSSIGDVVHTLPVLATLRRHGWRAGWLVEPAASPLLQDHPLLDEVAVAPAARSFTAGAALRTLRALRARDYDVALDVQGLWKSAAWARLSGAARTLGFAGTSRREPSSAWLAHERASPPPGSDHVIDKNLALLLPLGIDAAGSREFVLPRFEAEARAVEAGLAAANPRGRIALLNPGGGWESKRWPAERFGALASGLRERGVSSLVAWGPGEEPLARAVAVASGGAARPCLATSLRELVEFLRRVDLMVSNDTGPLHLACALGTPVVALFGPTDPARNGPFSSADETVRSIPPCAPCHRRRCARHEGVMARIEVQDVLAAVDRRLARGTRTVAL